MKIKPLAAEETCPATGSASNVSSATCVMATCTGNTARVITLTNADEAAVLGSFTLLATSQIFIQKDPTDELWVDNGTDVKLTKIAIQSA